MHRLTLLLLLVLALPLCAETKLSDLSWITGHWASTVNGVEMEELWSSPGGGMMLGLHRDISKKRTSFEFIRIQETKDGLVYLAQPGGRPPTPFKLTESTAKRVVFANPEHDFPKRIIYWLHESQLCARVEGDGDSAEQWCWARLK
jgi:hypothetical protein